MPNRVGLRLGIIFVHGIHRYGANKPKKLEGYLCLSSMFFLYLFKDKPS